MNDKDCKINDVSSKMSKRLITNAEMLRVSGDMKSFRTVADIGCDHGYVSIYLVQQKIADRAIAMDVRKGPLSGALSNIREFGLSEVITARLSDGLKELEPGEADAAIIAGMGGKLMIRILEDKDPCGLGIKEAVLQPQSDLDEFRRYIRNKGYTIASERIILDEGKYYFPMRVVFSKNGVPDSKGRIHDYVHEACTIIMDKSGCSQETAISICDRFGEHNILNRDELLRDYLKHGIDVSKSILQHLSESGHKQRQNELSKELSEMEAALMIFR